MKSVDIYIKPTCPFCVRAKKLLERREIPYNEISIAGDEDLRNAMIERANGRSTVPQIFIGDHHVGGYDDLFMLDVDRKLLPLYNQD